MSAVLFLYAFLSNVAVAVIPHEPVVIWYGNHLGVGVTALVATAGTALAAWVDHRLFAPMIWRAAAAAQQAGRTAGRLRRWFGRAPFAVLAASGLTPLPLFPFKALAFAARYPLWRYVAAITAGRLPRYLLLAWFGWALRIPTWPLVALFVLMSLPSLRRLVWKPASVR